MEHISKNGVKLEPGTVVIDPVTGEMGMWDGPCSCPEHINKPEYGAVIAVFGKLEGSFKACDLIAEVE